MIIRYSIIVRGSQLLLVMREGDRLHSLKRTLKERSAGTYSYNKECSGKTWLSSRSSLTDKGRSQPLTVVTWGSLSGLECNDVTKPKHIV